MISDAVRGIGMQDEDRYVEYTFLLRTLLMDDRDLAMTVSARRRLSILGRGVNDAEAYIARIDPLFTEVRARYVDALHRVKPKSKWLRTIIGTAIQETCETHGPDHPLVAELCAVQKRWPVRAGRSIARKVEQAEQEVANLRGTAPDRQYAAAVCALATRYYEAGRYDAMIDAYDGLVAELDSLDLDERAMTLFEDLVANAYYNHGEVTRAAPLLASLYAKGAERRRPDIPFEDLIDGAFLHLSTGRCYLATGQFSAAETVLRDSAERLRRHDDKLDNEHFHLLRHRTTYELGSALWKQGGKREAAECFQEAHELLVESRFANEKTATVYHSAKTYSLL